MTELGVCITIYDDLYTLSCHHFCNVKAWLAEYSIPTCPCKAQNEHLISDNEYPTPAFADS